MKTLPCINVGQSQTTGKGHQKRQAVLLVLTLKEHKCLRLYLILQCKMSKWFSTSLLAASLTLCCTNKKRVFSWFGTNCSVRFPWQGARFIILVLLGLISSRSHCLISLALFFSLWHMMGRLCGQPIAELTPHPFGSCRSTLKLHNQYSYHSAKPSHW